MAFSTDEQQLIAWYRALTRLEQMAINCWVMTGDSRLVLQLWSRIFAGEAHQFLEVPTPPRG